MQNFMGILEVIDAVLWHEAVLFTVLGVGILFTIWSGFCQYRALVHGTAVIQGKYDDKDDPGAINHFQALSAALSATVGLGNIGGVALAIALGGPGAVFWMWMVGLVGMALKLTEVTLSMIYRNTDVPDNPHGGPMWVAKHGFGKWGQGWGRFGTAVGGLFCLTLLVSTVTGGNMFQSWNVSDVTQSEFGIEKRVTGIILALVVGVVIIGGIKRIGAVAGRLVPFMCVLYLLSAVVVLIVKIDEVPGMFALIFQKAFSPTEAQGAFLGGTFGVALSMGMRRALFSSEAGQGSAPIAHSAAKTDEPVREGVVAGLEPFVDTIVVCTLTALVVLCSGAWNRAPNGAYGDDFRFVQADEPNTWVPAPTTLPAESRDGWDYGDDRAFLVVEVVEPETGKTDTKRSRAKVLDLESLSVEWAPIESEGPPTVLPYAGERYPIYRNYAGASLTTLSFNLVIPGLGTYLVVLASWLFAISTMISWSYYGEQGVIYLLGERAVMPYKFIYCALIIVAAWPGFITTEVVLDSFTSLGTGVMLWANIPIMLIFGYQAMRAYHDYFRRMGAGETEPPHAAPTVVDVVEGRDVE